MDKPVDLKVELGPQIADLLEAAAGEPVEFILIGFREGERDTPGGFHPVMLGNFHPNQMEDFLVSFGQFLENQPERAEVQFVSRENPTVN